MNGEVSYYHDRYGLEADAVLHLKDGRYALIEFKLGSKEIFVSYINGRNGSRLRKEVD